jgi:hypothetical protein
MMNAFRILFAILLAGPLGLGHSADDELLQYSELPPPQPLDARVEDVSVLSVSLRVESAGLARPTGFESVYRVPGNSDKLMRVNGALYAVFDQSVYQPGREGLRAVVPPSTVFHIGPPLAAIESSSRVEPARPVPAPIRSQGGAGYGVVPDVTPDSQSGHSVSGDLLPGSLPRFHSDLDYRSRRLAEIVARHLGR